MSHPHNGTDVTRKYFSHNGQRYQVTSFRGGKLEIYHVEDDGLEMWKGYCHEVNVDLGEAAYDAFQDAPGQRFLFDAGSASLLLLKDRRWAH